MFYRFLTGPRAPGVSAVAGLLLLLGASQPSAQLALPGAVAPTPEGSIASPSGAPRKRREAPAVAPKLPSDDTIIGHALHLDGTRSTIELQRSGDEIRVARLTLTGDRLSRSGETCAVEVVETPLSLTARESAKGLHRYQLDFPACPFSFDILDGAILASNEGKACEIKAADCRTDPAGLWGMGADEFDPKRAADMLGGRARVEKTVRSVFNTLYEKNKKDKAARSVLVREQAGFSSRREEICRSYAQEAEFGYCALRVTEARALALGTQLAKGAPMPREPEAALKADNDDGRREKRRVR
jgi:hypothetical protein